MFDKPAWAPPTFRVSIYVWYSQPLLGVQTRFGGECNGIRNCHNHLKYHSRKSERTQHKLPSKQSLSFARQFVRISMALLFIYRKLTSRAKRQSVTLHSRIMRNAARRRHNNNDALHRRLPNPLLMGLKAVYSSRRSDFLSLSEQHTERIFGSSDPHTKIMMMPSQSVEHGNIRLKSRS